MPVSCIRVPARFALEEGEPVTKVATFVLGEGPCGKDVIRLLVQYRRSMVVIVQRHRDGTSAEFVYPLSQLTGRVEVQYG